MKPLTLNFDKNSCIEPAMLHFPNSTQREFLSNN